MELEREDRVLPVTQPHDDPPRLPPLPGGHLERRREARFPHDEGVVPGRDERVPNAFEERIVAVPDAGGFPMAGAGRADHPGPVVVGDGLVAEADPQGGDLRGELLEDAVRHPEGPAVGGVSRPRGEDDRFRVEARHLLERHIGTEGSDLRPLGGERLVEVVDEGVLVIDERDLHLPRTPPAPSGVPGSSRLSSRESFCSVSSHSCRGFEACTIPAPASV